jgi:hypothetical protein
MSSDPPNLRCERKFISAGCSLPEVQALVRRHPAAFREAYPPRTVNNVYLDSPELADYHDHVAGTANRAKTRVRWYGPWEGEARKPTLERKLKRGTVSGKASHALPGFALDGLPLGQALEAAVFQAELPDLLHLAMRHLRPALANRYQRHYYVSASGQFRVTLDSQLQFARPTNGLKWEVPGGVMTHAIILELKYLPRHEEQASAITNSFPFRLTRCSKYVLGLETLGAV